MSIMIFGTGKYGTALFQWLTNYGVKVSGFLKSKCADGEVYRDRPVYSVNSLKKSLTSLVVLIAVADKHTRVMVRNALILQGMDENKIIDCAGLINDNGLLNYGHRGYCNLCGSFVTFSAYGLEEGVYQKYHVIGGGRRENAICPICGGMDRTRWCMYVLEKYTQILDVPCSVLHFAPEEGITKLIRTNKECNYISGDLNMEAMLQIDMRNIPFCDKKFDYVIANHVLEHILEERQAVKELIRVTKDDGMIILSVPICTEENTKEDENIISKEDRLINFGLEDHVRLHGKDYLGRFESYGLSIEVKQPLKELESELIDKYGLIEDDIIMLCRKKQDSFL